MIPYLTPKIKMGFIISIPSKITSWGESKHWIPSCKSDFKISLNNARFQTEIDGGT